MQYPRLYQNCPIYKSDGTQVLPDQSGYSALASGTTYYAILGGVSAPLVSAHVLGNAAVILTSVNVEDTCFDDVNEWSSTAGEWVTENPTGAYVAATGTGWSATNMQGAAAGTGAGGLMFHLGNLGSRRIRLKFVVGATGGNVRVGAHGKS